jgi:hypothetical protein
MSRQTAARWAAVCFERSVEGGAAARLEEMSPDEVGVPRVELLNCDE